MPTYGIDAHLLLRKETTGVPRYARQLLLFMMQAPLLEGEKVILYAHAAKPDDFTLAPGWTWKVISWPFARGWTHGGLSYELIRHPVDVVFVPGHEVPTFFNKKKTRMVTTIHDVAFRRVPESYSRDARFRQEWAVRGAVKKATRLISVSESTKRDLVELYGAPIEKIAVTPLAVNVSDYNMAEETRREVLQRYRLSPGKYFFFVGRLEEKKNVAVLVEAFAELKRKLGIGHPLELILAGTPGYGSEQILRAIATATGVRTIGYVSDVDAVALMCGALAVCFPSKYEGFGLPILEAFAAEVPVIASDIPSSREVAGEAALFVPVENIPAWTSAMEQCLLTADMRTSLVAKGKIQLQKYSWEATASATWAALRNL